MPSKRILCIGAHPDDMEIRCGGTAVQLAAAGHVVKFVSLCNGNCGHYDKTISPEALAERRYAETQASKAISGVAEYEIWSDSSDCELEPTVENRRRVVRMIRQFDPDVVLSHRLCDYHADHRAAAQLVQDAAYLSQVPRFCPDTPIQKTAPVFGCFWDAFTDPRPFRCDAMIPVDSVMELKCRMLDCHVSQVYEWLAWERKEIFDHTKWTWEQKKAFLLKHWGSRYIKAADMGRDRLIQLYGEAGRNVQYAEAFELSEYGRKISVDEFQAMLQP